MRKLTLINIILALGLTAFAPSSSFGLDLFSSPGSHEEISADLVSDIDWTLVYSLRGDEPGLKKSKVIRVEGKQYRIADHAEDTLLLLSQIPGFRFSFFSGGQSTRNIELLKSVKLRDGRTAYSLTLEKVTNAELFQAHKFHQHVRPRLFSFDDLTQIKEMNDPFPLVNGHAPIVGFFRKDLKKILPYSDLSKIIMIDDLKDVLVQGEEENLLWLGQTYNFIENFDSYLLRSENAMDLKSTVRSITKSGTQTVAQPKFEYNPPDKISWLFERNKWPWIAAVILESRELSQKNKLTFSAAVQITQKKATLVDRRWNYVNRGLKAIGKKPLSQHTIQCSVLGDLYGSSPTP